MEEQEKLLDDIEQEIITPPRNGKKSQAPMPKKKERLARDTLDIDIAQKL